MEPVRQGLQLRRDAGRLEICTDAIVADSGRSDAVERGARAQEIAELGGRWYTFDARHNVPRIGRIVMVRGRDAANVAFSTTFGPNVLRRFCRAHR
jgi:hypothetical protein